MACRVKMAIRGASLSWVLIALAVGGCQSPGTNDGDPEARDGGGASPTYRVQSLEATEIVEAPETGIDLGWGWDSFDAKPVRTVCVEFAEQSEPAQSRMMTMHEVSDSYEVMQRIGMSAEASVKTISFEASGKAAFAKELNVNGFSSTFVLNATVENGVRYAAPLPISREPSAESTTATGGAVRLTEEAAALARSGDLDDFKHRCGNAFVSAVYSGAKLTAVLTVQEESHSDQESLSAELSGSGWGARMKASVEGMNTSTDKEERLDLSIFQVGGRGDAIPASKEDLLEKLEVLSSLAFDAPKDFHIAVTPYEVLSNWPGKTIGGEEHEFDELASTWGAYNTLYDEMQAVLDKPGDYRAPGLEGVVLGVGQEGCPVLVPLRDEHVERLKTAQDEVREALLGIEEEALRCVKKPAACEFNVAEYRSPYAYRAMLPLPDGVIVGLKKVQLDQHGKGTERDPCRAPECRIVFSIPAGSAPVLAAYTIADTAKRRCALDLRNPGCLSNAEIDSWAEKVGMVSVALADDDEVEALAGALPEFLESCNQKRPAYSMEAGFPALWYRPEREDDVHVALSARRASVADPAETGGGS